MSSKRQRFKALTKLSKKLRLLTKQSLHTIKRPINRLLRNLFLTKKRRSYANAGFVLPTVVMVGLVVVLLTAAILFRSFERAKNASNVRVNEVVLNAATPALDRARAKLDALFEDPTLPRGTPSDNSLYEALKRDKYTLGDETRLKLGFDIDGDNSISQPDDSTDLEDDETSKTAWKYFVDTDNNGKKDTITLYGVFFRSPSRNATTGLFNRERNPLEARTPPMDNGTTNQACTGASGFASLVGNSSWYRLNSGNLGKSFFVYVVNVPITELGSLSSTDYEVYNGNKSVVALELQQDRSRVPLPNNAVWFENDLEIMVGSTALLLNGRIHTNGNLLVAKINSSGSITLRQVSSKTSCFYNQENGQVIVGGNVKNGGFTSASSGDITVDLYRGFGSDVTTASINNTNRSTNAANNNVNIEFNDAAFNHRIAAMKVSAIALCSDCNTATDTAALKTAVAGSTYPDDVKNNVDSKVQATDSLEQARKTLEEEIEIYLRNRTRRVPYAEVADFTQTSAIGTYTSANLGDTTIPDTLAPPAAWRQPINSSNQFTGATTITVNVAQLPATHPTVQRKEGVQTELGDRVFVGNNLPSKWLKDNKYVGSETNQLIFSSGTTAQNWTRFGTETQRQRWRNTQIQSLADLGVSDRDGFWEENASISPANDLDSVGGVRIITGAGIYVDDPDVGSATTDAFYDRPTLSFLSDPPDPTPLDNTDIPVWPDTMPMSTPGDNRKGDLLMRATAFYHYKIDAGKDQEPIACISSYYDPSDTTFNKNKTGLTVPPVPPATTPTTVNLPWNAATGGRSNNGIVYNYPTDGRSTFFNTHKARLERQANLKFPNGRWANEPLRDALTKLKATNSGSLPSTIPSTGLDLSDYSAIDTALCSISILSDEAAFVTTPSNQPPHGAVTEAAFLDGREVRQLSTPVTSNDYNLDLEQRQPLEIRTTDINVGQLATTAITSGSGASATTSEYLLPYSGIIYATRDDALSDASDPSSQSAILSRTDFLLDPRRRPNGIRLTNGGTLARTSTNVYNAREKGLILASNLPAYIRGNFNLHRINTSSTTEIEEFTQTEPTTNFYARSTRNQSFACRKDRPGCTLPAGDTTGDFWRPATIIADSMTLQSSNFKDGVRSEGDYDLNYNAGLAVEGNFNPANISIPVSPATTSVLSTLDSRRQNRLKNGFWDNYFATNTTWWSGTNTTPNLTSVGSYTVNGITPIQRRVNAPMYVMEICRRSLISDCQPGDWVVGFDINGDNDVEDAVSAFDVNGDGTIDSLDVEKDIKTYQLGQAVLAAAPSGTTTINSSWWNSPYGTGNKTIRQRLGAGDTALQPALSSQDRSYPRRIAFARYGSGVTGRVNNELVSSNTSAPFLYKPIGIGCPLDITGSGYTGNGCVYGGTTAGTNYGQTGNNALWFRTTNSTTNPGDLTASQVSYANNRPLFYFPPTAVDGQPLLVPVLQVHDANASNTTSIRDETTYQNEFRSNWLQQATNTNYNATFVVGNSPSRVNELSAGLQNFVRFLENWTSTTAKIRGSFIQLSRSSFSTAPIAPVFTARQTTITSSTTNNLSLFDYLLDTYPTNNSNGLLPFYSPPDRNWGFDVALLSEQPDLFAQRFTAPPTGRPNEFFREIGRDDSWAKILLCAGETSSGTSYTSAVPSQYRPSDCKSIPND